jgi:hypothetical protein
MKNLQVLKNGMFTFASILFAKMSCVVFFSHDIHWVPPGTPRYPLDIMGKTLLFYKIIDFYTMCITFSHRALPNQAHLSSALHGPFFQ